MSVEIRELKKEDLFNGFLTTLDALRETSNIEKEFLSLIPSISAYRTANMKQIYIVLMHNAARALYGKIVLYDL